MKHRWEDYIDPCLRVDFLEQERVYCAEANKKFEEARTAVLRKRKEFLEKYLEQLEEQDG